MLGPPDVSPVAHGDSAHALAFATAMPAGYAEGGDEDLSFAFDGAKSLEANGYSEFFEVDFDEAVYVTRVEIGENRGPGAIVNIRAWDNRTETFGLIWAGTADPDTDAVYQATGQYHVFVPTPICRMPYATTRRVFQRSRLEERFQVSS